jgi:hypothetical protein
MDRVTVWAIRVAVVLVAVLVIGLVVGGLFYKPKLDRALAEAARGRADTVTAEAETEYQADVADYQAEAQAAEITIHLQNAESTRAIQAAPGAGDTVSPDLYSAFRDGVHRNRATADSGAASPDAAP